MSGEAVFQTGMVGYPEALTDPSYRGQLLVLTYPVIGNYGVPDTDAVDDANVPLHFESDAVHPAALIVCDYTAEYSHWNAQRSLADWLQAERIAAIAGVDTRHLTMVIREAGTMLARIVVGHDVASPAPPMTDPNLRNLVAEVSGAQPKVYSGARKGDPAAPRIVIVDCGIKYNQLRALRKRSASVTVVPWDVNLAQYDQPGVCDAIFVSNGPGDPTTVSVTIDNLRAAMARRPDRPIFGICLGHQLLALAAGFTTFKLKYGNRGHNQPCVELTTGRCHITSQNHGFAVDTDHADAPVDWFPTFVNANDGTNEGVAHKQLPFFSVQFHPEASAGPRDTQYLFDVFVQAAESCRAGRPITPLFDSALVVSRDVKSRMPRNSTVPSVLSSSSAGPRNRLNVRKVIVLGSGGLSIGQAGEFDYSGSQALKALKTQSVRTILINPNIATVQTSRGLADKVYFLPVTAENVLKVAESERPDGILVTFGGQTALNCGVELYRSGELERLGIRVLGTPIEAILDTEDRERFNARLTEIDEPFAKSRACETIEGCLSAAEEIEYPVILRAAFALGGLGSGFANNASELTELASRAFSSSSQVLVERSMKGWKEIEYEVVRDAYDNCITVCNMENFDPLGVHTGDSIVVAPSQTLTDAEYHMLRDCALRTVRHLGVVGECNIQYALNPRSMQYCIIEVNARLSRSSALASKATGYPLAFVAALLALNIPLPEIRNSITQETSACFEPSLDYLVVKVPRWDLKKFPRVSRVLGSSMKSVGEVMAIGRTFEEALQKAARMVSDNYVSGFESGSIEYSEDAMTNPTDDRLLAIADGLAKGVSVDTIHDLTKIDKWFLYKLARISRHESILRGQSDLALDELVRAKELGFSDRQIAKLIDDTELAVRQLRVQADVRPCVKQIDTVAAEFPAKTNYLYVTYACTASLQGRRSLGEQVVMSSSPPVGSPLSSSRKTGVRRHDDVRFDEHGVIVLGCGAYRIGSSVEFDCCAVSATRTLRQNGTRSVMINYNPETVSTDYDECDRLYFEELSFERVLDIYDLERSSGIIVSMGGQIANNIAMALHRQSARILGTTPEMIDSAENRYKFSRMLDRIGVDQPRWKELSSIDDAKAFCNDVGYPVLVRPSYVLSGAAMNVTHKAEDLEAYLGEAATLSPDCPVVISKFIEEAKEIEVDAVARKGELVMHVISEHVENAGVHSGDATLVLPPQDLDGITVCKVEEATAKVAQALNVTGPMNIQFMAKDNKIKMIECNLRASRSLPFVSKTIGLDMARMATKVILGKSVRPYPVDYKSVPFVGVKVAQFSFTRLPGCEVSCGVNMISTGEAAGYGATREEAYMKGLMATKMYLPKSTIAVSIGSYKAKLEFLSSAKRLQEIGIKLIATPGTADFFQEHGVTAEVALWSTKNEYTEAEGENTIDKMLRDGRVEFFINIPSNNQYRRLASYESPGYASRRAAVDFNVPLLTNIKCAKLFVKVMEMMHACGGNIPLAAHDARFSARVVTLPGLVLLNAEIDSRNRGSWSAATGAALRGGFSFIAATQAHGCWSPETLTEAVKIGERDALCDFSVYASARPGNEAVVQPLAGRVAGLYIAPDESSEADVWMRHFETWPSNSPIAVKATGRSLAALLFAAVVSSRDIHVCQVATRPDIQLVQASKKRGLGVTCDVNVLDLYATDLSGRIGRSDQEALWENLDMVDAVTGPSEFVLPLLLASVYDGRISMEWVRAVLLEGPCMILGMSSSLFASSVVEVDLDETFEGPAASQVAGIACRGAVRRVVVQDKVAYLDGKIWAEPGSGCNVNVDGAIERPIVPLTATVVRRTEIPDEDLSLVETSIPAPHPVPVSRLDCAVNIKGGLGANGIPVRSPLISQTPVVLRSHNLSLEMQQPMAPNLTNGMQIDGISGELVAASVPLVSSVLDALPGYGIGWWAGRHILSVAQFSRDDLHALFEVAQEMRTMVSRVGHYELLRGKVMASLFYEPSTRTSCSFQVAMQRLGGTVLSIQNTAVSSVAKGESLSDTIRTLGCYTDITVLRHPAIGAPEEAAAYARHPVISAGDGAGEHPTQALLDVFTIREELGTVNGITVTFVGDLKNGRTVHSLARLLALYSVKVNYVSPDVLGMPSDVLEELASRGVHQFEHRDLTDALMRETDVLYVTRVQKERFDSLDEYEAVKLSYTITPRTLTRAKEAMIVMHPLPRVSEISPAVDSDPRAVYFRQMEHGMYVRMALLSMVLGKN